jgi:hypothetical protein
MIPVYQTRFRNDEPGALPGNCTQATLASIFELPLDAVPDFRSDANGRQVEKIAAFARSQGYEYRVMPSALVYPPKGYHTISGVSPRGVRHLVVGYNGKIVHDPHPEGGGVVIDKYGFFIPLVLRPDQDKITQIRFRDTTTSPETSAMAFDSRSLVGGLLGALVVGGAVALTKKKGPVKIPWIPLAAGAIGGTLAVTYATWGEPATAGVGAVSLSEVKDAKRRAKIATAEARTAREQTEIARGQRRQEHERAKKGMRSIDVAQAEVTAAEEGYDAELLARRSDQFDEDLEDDDEPQMAGVGRISIGRIQDISVFSTGGDDDDDDLEDDEDDEDDDDGEPAPRQKQQARPRGGPPAQEQSLPSMLAGAATSTAQRSHQVRPGQQKGRPGPQPQGKRPGPQPQGKRPGPQGPGQRRPAPAPKAEAPPEDEFPVLGFSAGAAPMGGGGFPGMGMFGGGK